MVESAIIQEIVSITDADRGGDNALDGFDFQVSSAIYLIFEELKNKKDFALLYEKLEDFIVFTDKIQLYQAKSIGENLTPRVLYRAAKTTKKDSSTLSIIEKMYDNYSRVKQKTATYEVTSNLLICENKVFSNKLSKNISNIRDLRRINLNLLDSNVKSEIISKTKNSNYEWSKINAIRLIPKKRHEEVTRVFIEDVIRILIGENKINSLALYNSLTNEIRRIRKQKTTLTKDYLMSQINKFAVIDDDLSINQYIHLLNEEDKRNIQIHLSFKAIQHYLRIKNHAYVYDYKRIKDFYLKHQFENLDHIYRIVLSTDSFLDIRVRLNEFEIKALILFVIAKEMN